MGLAPPAHRAGPRAVGVSRCWCLLVLTRFTDTWIATEWYYYRSRYDALDPNDLQCAR